MPSFRSYFALPLALVVCGCDKGSGPAQAPRQSAPATTAASSAAARELPVEGRLVDLTHAFDERTVYWPTEAGFRLERGFFGVTEGGWFYSANRFAAAEHGGTHLDAPIHFYRDHQTVDQVPLDRLIGAGAVIDVTEACAADVDYQVSVADFQAWEARTGQRLDERLVLVRTGFARYWPDRASYLGTTESGPDALRKLHFPGIAPAAAQWLVESRRVKALGIDTASIDRGQSADFATHVILCQHNVPILENVADLASLPAAGFTVIALPMKIAGGSGGPLRIVAVVPAS